MYHSKWANFPRKVLEYISFRVLIDYTQRSMSDDIHIFCREEMEDVVGSVFDLMGRTSDPLLEEEVISERVDTIFEVCRSYR